MGTYLNPGNKGFQEILRSEYVDKTGLIALVNKTVGTRQKLTCISRPRRSSGGYDRGKSRGCSKGYRGDT